MMSGNIFTENCFEADQKFAGQLARKIGYEGSGNEKEILEFLQKVDPVKIVESQDVLEKCDGHTPSFVPHIESYTTDETFISSRPFELLKNAWSNDIDVLIGGVANERSAEISILNDPSALENFKLQDIIPTEIDTNHPKVLEFLEELKKIYYSEGFDPTNNKIAYSQVCLID